MSNTYKNQQSNCSIITTSGIILRGASRLYQPNDGEEVTGMSAYGNVIAEGDKYEF